MTDEYENYGIILLNRTGDVSVSWDSPDDVEVLTFIQKKIDAGYVFFIIEDRFFKLMKRKKRITDVNEIGKDRTVFLDDDDAEALTKNGKFRVTKSTQKASADIKTRKAKDAKDVASHTSFGVRPAYAG